MNRFDCHRLSQGLALVPFPLIMMCLLLTGCGTSEYEQLYTDKLIELRHETPFRALWREPVSDLPNSALTLRLPRAFTTVNSYAFDATSPEPRSKTPEVVDPHRVQPYFLHLTGHQRTYECFTPVENAKVTGNILDRPVYLYIYITPTRGKNKTLTASELENLLRGKLVEKFGDGVSKWEGIEVPTPDGTSLNWRRLKAVGSQDFVEYDNNYPRPKVYDGEYLLYLRSMPNYHVILGWRCGTDAAAAIHLESIADLVAGTVKVAE